MKYAQQCKRQGYYVKVYESILSKNTIKKREVYCKDIIGRSHKQWSGATASGCEQMKHALTYILASFEDLTYTFTFLFKYLINTRTKRGGWDQCEVVGCPYNSKIPRTELKCWKFFVLTEVKKIGLYCGLYSNGFYNGSVQ